MAKEKKEKQASYEANGRIQVRVSDFEHGVRVFNNVKLVRVKSQDYTLLIMEDYFPLLGSVNGGVELVTEDDLVDLGQMEGFYMHRNNEFSLLVENYRSAGPAANAEGAAI